MPNISTVYKELTTDWSTSSTGAYEEFAETSALNSGEKYIVIVNVQAGSESGKNINLRCLIKGEEIAGSEFSKESISSLHETRYSYITLVEPSSSGQKISLEAKAEFGSVINVKTATIACLNLSNLVAGSDYIFEENTPSQENTESYQDLIKISIPATKKTTGDWLILAGCQFDINTSVASLENAIEYKGTETYPRTIENHASSDGFSNNYMQRVVSVPYLGLPPHLGGTVSDGAYKQVTLKSRDTSNRPQNNSCLQAKIFALRLQSTQHSAYFQSEDSYSLSSTLGEFDQIAAISQYQPPQDNVLTTSAGSFRTGETLILGYGSFCPNGNASSDVRCWINIQWSDPDYEDFISGLSSESICVAATSSEKLPLGFAGVQSPSSLSSNKKIKMLARTYSTVGAVEGRSLCAIGLGAPVPSETQGPRAKLEMNRVIRLS